MNQSKLFCRDFTLVIIGQIISLFGNNVLRFALPLYLLNQTHSAALLGIVCACSFIPMIILSPIGGIIADRINKRNVMVLLDFCTAGLILIFSVLLGRIDLVSLIIVTMIILYGIQGAYQPSVQASIPVLVSAEKIIAANSVVTLVNSLANLIGPVIGGAVFGLYGIRPVLTVSMICFFISAVMELFIHIPFIKKPSFGNIFTIAKNDLKDGIYFIKNEKPIFGKLALFIAAINFFLTALLIIGLPVLITQKMGFSRDTGNRLYGYCEGAMAAGGLLGGLIAASFSKKLDVKKSYELLYLCSFMLLPIGLTQLIHFSPMVSYGIIMGCSFLIIMASTVFSIQMISYVQLVTPSDLIGKIMSLTMCVCMIANPVGQAIYGLLFDKISNKLYLIFIFATLFTFLIALLSRKEFKRIPNVLQKEEENPTDFVPSNSVNS